MCRLLGLALVAPLLAGCGWLGGWAPYSGTSTQSGTATLHVVPIKPPNVPRWVHLEHLPARAVPGAKLFASVGCTTCHTYAGSGSSNLNAPDLTVIGQRHLGIRLQVRHLRNPSSVAPGSPMPSFARLGQKRLHQLAVFLEASKGTR
jgi:cytochrome c oxidase subunit II